MKEKEAQRWWYRLLRVDLGRKLTGLLCAVVLFSILDSQIQSNSGWLPVRVQFAERDELFELYANRNHEFILVVLERLDEERPLVATAQSRSRDFSTTLELRGPKTAIDRLKSDGAVFRYAPKEGHNRIEKEQIEGVESVESVESIKNRLGPSGNLDWQDLPVFDATLEVLKQVELSYLDIEVEGLPAAGRYYLSEPGSALFLPPGITLRGPKNLLDDLPRLRPLFEPILVQGEEQNPWTSPLSLRGLLRESIRLEEPEGGPKVQLTFTLRMVEPKKEEESPPARFQREIIVQYDRELLADNSFHKEGRKLRFEDSELEERGTLDLVIEVPEPEAVSVSNQHLRLARQYVALFVRAHEAEHLEGNSMPVYIVTFPNFPRSWNVRFVHPSDSQVRMRWGDSQESSAATVDRDSKE